MTATALTHGTVHILLRYNLTKPPDLARRKASDSPVTGEVHRDQCQPSSLLHLLNRSIASDIRQVLFAERHNTLTVNQSSLATSSSCFVNYYGRLSNVSPMSPIV